MVTDPIADMLTRIRNANRMRNETVEMPSSKNKVAIARILQSEGYIDGYEIAGDSVKRSLKLRLKYVGADRVITGLKRISKPGLRVYSKAEELPRVLNGLGIAIISTSNGMMTDKEARGRGLGGEVVAYVW